MPLSTLPTAQAIDILAQFGRVTDFWSPKVIAQVNDQYVKVARLLGEMDWHQHAAEDELFWVVRGRLRLEFRDHAVELEPGSAASFPAAWSIIRSPPRSAGSC